MADAVVTGSRGDRDRPNTENGGAFIEEVAAENAAVRFGEHAEELIVRMQRGDEFYCVLGAGEVRGKMMSDGDLAECLVTDCPAACGVGGGHGAYTVQQ
jgi:hypothetical protein